MKTKNLVRVIIPVCILLPFIIISFYNHPALDDWWYAEVFKQHGFFGAQKYWYDHYTGRFFSNFAMTIAPLSFGFIEGHKIMPVIFICCLYCANYLLARTFFTKLNTSRQVVALWLTAAYLLIQRDYFECLYWLAANVIYQFTFLFFLVHLILMYKIMVEGRFKTIHQLFAVLLGIAVTGSNETMGGLVLLESLLLLVFTLRKRTVNVFVIVLLLSQLISWAIMFAAPGNWAKISDATQEHVYTMSFWKSVSYSFLSMGYYAVYLLRQPGVWCLIVLAIPVIEFLKNNYFTFLAERKYFYFGSLFILSISFAVYFISIFPTGIFIPPLRVTNIAIVFIFLFICVWVWFLAGHIPAVSRRLFLIKRYSAFIMLLCLVFTAVTPTKFRNMLCEMVSGSASGYNKEMYARYELIKASAADTIVVPKLMHIPRTIVATDVSGRVQQNIGLVFGKLQPVKTPE